MFKKRKPCLVGALILALAFSMAGCAALQNVATTMGTIIATVQQAVCSPTADQKAVADQVKIAIAQGVVLGTTIAVSLSNGAIVTVTADQAMAVMDTIQAGICVGLDDLEAALVWFSEMVNSTKAAKVRAGIELPLYPNTEPLWEMIRAARNN